MNELLKKVINSLYYLVKPRRSVSNKSSAIEQIIFNTLLLAGTLISLIFSVFNLISLHDIILSFITVIAGVLFFALYLLSRRKGYQNIWLTIIIVLSLLSVLWFMNGGALGSTAYLYILSLFLIIIISKPLQQNMVFLIFLVNIGILYFLEYFHGEKLVHSYSSHRGYYMDMIFTFVLVLFFVFSLLRFFKRLYETEKATVEKQKVIIQQQNEEYLSSLRYASNLQKMILPEEEQLQFLFDDYFVLFKPKDIVSGDFYWIKQKEGYGVVVVADCTGHGVPAAFLGILGISLLEETIEHMSGEWTAADFLEKLRLKFIVYTQKNHNSSENIHDSIDLGVCVVNYKESIIQYAGANRSLLMVRNKNVTTPVDYKIIDSSQTHSLYMCVGTKNTIGYNYQELKFKNYSIDFVSGDTFYLFSDGYGDQFDTTNKQKFKVGRLKKEILKIQNLPMYTQADYLDSIHKIWKGEIEQTDDILIVGLKI
jgi:serine phosphatase RsbU (regulator of sigma subunit)